MTDLFATPERQALRETVRRFVTTDVLPYQDDWEREGELPRSLHVRAAELGLIGLAYPESVGGGGGNAIDGVVLTEELAYAGCAGGLLASSALLGIVLGFAAQRTLGNFVAGILIALAQPVRIGDRVEYDGNSGVVEEIGLTYTFIRALDRRRIVVPNEKLASDTIVNSSIRSAETFAEVSVPVPLASDLDAALDALREDVAGERDASVHVSTLADPAIVTVRAAAADELAAERLEQELRLRAHRRLRTLGVWT